MSDKRLLVLYYSEGGSTGQSFIVEMSAEELMRLLRSQCENEIQNLTHVL